MGAENISILPGGEKPPTKEPPKGKNPSTTRDSTQTAQKANLECLDKEMKETTESHRIPIREVHSTKTASEVKHQEAQKQTKRVT